MPGHMLAQRERYEALCALPAPPRPRAPAPPPPLPARPPRPEQQVLAGVAHVFAVEPADLVGFSRARPIALARQAAMWLLRKHYALSLPEIGRLLGGRDHSTVAYGVAQAEERAHADAHYAACLAALTPIPEPHDPEAVISQLEELATRDLDDWADGELEDLLAALTAVNRRAHDELTRRLTPDPNA